MMNSHRRTQLFLGGILLLTLIATGLILSTLIITEETLWTSLFWVGGFSFLFLNIAYLFLLSLSHLFIKFPVVSEVFVKPYPKTAMVYPVRNEDYGLFERIDYSFSGNAITNLDLWILSDSDPEYEASEQKVVARLQEKHGNRIFYRRRDKHTERKQGNLKEFLVTHPEYKYLYISDADGMVPKGVVLKLLRKALHPENQDVAIFQCFIKITHASTWYARFERIGASFGQRFNFTALQAILGRSISFGHHHLVRADLLNRIKLPKGLLSHDNWDTVLLDQLGYRVVFCPDVVAYDEAPSHYLEARARSRRWSQGTLQGIPLITMPNVNPGTRLLAFLGPFLYISDLIFFVWVLFGVAAHSAPFGQLIYFKIDSIWMGLFTNNILKWMLLFSIGVIIFHKITIVRSVKDSLHYFYELLFSTLVMLNNFLYVPLDILTLPLRKLVWRPMSKNPFESLGFKTSFQNLWVGTLFGIYGLYFCTKETPYFVWQMTPILVSLIFSVPLVYLTSKAVPKRFMSWI